MENELGELIRDQRKKSGISQAGLADKCLVSSQMIYLIEGGNRMPSVRLLKSIFTELGISDRFESWRWELDTQYL